MEGFVGSEVRKGACHGGWSVAQCVAAVWVVSGSDLGHAVRTDTPALDSEK